MFDSANDHHLIFLSISRDSSVLWVTIWFFNFFETCYFGFPVIKILESSEASSVDESIININLRVKITKKENFNLIRCFSVTVIKIKYNTNSTKIIINF